MTVYQNVLLPLRLSSFLPQEKEQFTAISSSVVYLFVALELIHLTADMRAYWRFIKVERRAEVGRFLSKHIL